MFKLLKWQILSNSLERYFSMTKIFSNTFLFQHKVEILDHLFSVIQRSTCKSYKTSDRNSENTWSIHKGENSINDFGFHSHTHSKWSNRHYLTMASQNQNLPVDKSSEFLIKKDPIKKHNFCITSLLWISPIIQVAELLI